METLSVIKEKIENIPIFKDNHYYFTENKYHNSFETLFPKIVYFMASARIEPLFLMLSIIFIKTNALGYNSNSFIVEIHNFRRHQTLHLDTYLRKKYGIDPLIKLSWNNYEGTEEEKINRFFNFLEEILNDDLMKGVLEGKDWSKEYEWRKIAD